MKKLTLLVASAAIMLAACSEPLEEPLCDIEIPSDTVSAPTKQQTILGKPLENPYSLDYMRKALDEYRKTTLSKAALNYEIKANFLHVRFLPANPEQFEQLLADTTIELFDRPMLCEIEQEGDYYHDPSLPEDAITWQYTTVPIDYKFPNVEYEILDSCFVPEDEPETLTKSLRGFNPEKLSAIAFRLAGQEYEEENTLTKKRKVPSGQFRVLNTAFAADSETNYSWTGIIGIKVRVYNGIRWDHTHTDANGNYKMSKHYATRLRYHIKFRTSDDIIINNRMFDIDAADMGLGWHPKEGYSKDFATNSDAWMWATVNNAVYIFRKQLCPHFQIPAPDIKLYIFAANKESSFANKTGCAPMCRHMAIKFPKWMEWCMLTFGFAEDIRNIANNLAPDVMIFKRETTEKVYSIVFHELSHVCHFRKVGHRYWQNYVKFTIDHEGYGKRTDNESGYTGVGEMWGYYFGSYVCSKYYMNYTSDWNENKSWFKPGILYYLVQNAGLTESQIFDCLTSNVNNHEILKNVLCSKYPNKRSLIIKEFNNYKF